MLFKVFWVNIESFFFLGWLRYEDCVIIVGILLFCLGDTFVRFLDRGLGLIILVVSFLFEGLVFFDVLVAELFLKVFFRIELD